MPHDAPPPGTETGNALAYWTLPGGTGELRPALLQPPGPGEVLVRALFSGISRGTEMLVQRGEVPARLAETMRAPFQEGEFGQAVKYGYCMVGLVEAGPPDLIGRPVFVLHPHQSRFVVPAEVAHPLPDDVPPARAVLAANMETALNAVWDAGVGPGDRVAVIGAGAVGLLLARLVARIPGIELALADVDPGKAPVAAAVGLGLVHPRDLPEGRDIVFHASGNPEGLARALEIAGDEAMVVELSWYGTRVVPLPLGADFHPRRLVLRSSQVGALPPARRPRWTHRRRLAAALGLLADPALDALFAPDAPFAEAPAVFARLGRGAGSPLFQRLTYET